MHGPYIRDRPAPKSHGRSFVWHVSRLRVGPQIGRAVPGGEDRRASTPRAACSRATRTCPRLQPFVEKAASALPHGQINGRAGHHAALWPLNVTRARRREP